MSEERFSPIEGMSCLLVGDNGVAISSVEACDLLNSQAETIEVLRETIIAYVPYDIIEFWRMAAGDHSPFYDEFRDVVKRRIAALEGK